MTEELHTVAECINKGLAIMVAGLGVGGSSVDSILTGRRIPHITVDDRKPAAYTFADVLSSSFKWDTVGCIVTSPGFSPYSDFLMCTARNNIPVISEVEFAWQISSDSSGTGSRAQWIGITGTNGKTSTTEMTSEIMRANGFSAPAVGNIGTPVSQAAVDKDNRMLVVELSSFQLHYTYSIRLAAAAITNLAQDHLDWHGGFDRYVADKARIYSNVTDALVYNADDARVAHIAHGTVLREGCERIGFTLKPPAEGQIGVEKGWITDRRHPSGPAPARIAPLTDFPHLCEPDGTVYPHLLADALCAFCLAAGMGVDLQDAAHALAGFAPGGHRIVKVASYIPGPGQPAIRFIDDSKATNAHAAAASLSSFPDRSVVWIAGGLTKGAHFDDLVRSQSHVMTSVVVIGKDQAYILEALKKYAPDIPYTLIDPSDNTTVMKRAVDAAGRYAQPGDAVLLAPACASMDQFASYADRGDKFAVCAKEWVKAKQDTGQEAE